MKIKPLQACKFSMPNETKGLGLTQWKGASSYERVVYYNPEPTQSKQGKSDRSHEETGSCPLYHYPAMRGHSFLIEHRLPGIEASMTPQYPAEHYHSRSLIKSVIPKLLSTNQKVRILELGAGTGLATDEIRTKFAEEIKSGKLKVYSTGLVKRAAQQLRGEFRFSKLHKNDLNWRSIKELSDFPEFHLIYETFGEVNYSANRLNSLEDYLILICKKLMPGGFASISSINYDLIDEATLKFGLKLSNDQIDKVMNNQLSINTDMHDREEKMQYFNQAINEIFTSVENSLAKEGINVRIYLNKTDKYCCLEIQKAPYPFKPSNLFEWAFQKKIFHFK